MGYSWKKKKKKKKQAGGVEDMEFPGFLKKENVEIPGVN